MTLPVPLEFELPGPDWEPVAPDSLGVENAAFLAVRRNLGAVYSPTLTISGALRPDPATLVDIADEAVALLRAQARDVEVLKRDEIPSDHAPAVTQLSSAVADVDGLELRMRHGQAIFGYVDVDDPTKRVVVIHTITCTEAQFPLVREEFQAYLRTVRVLPPEPPSEAPPAPGPPPAPVS